MKQRTLSSLCRKLGYQFKNLALLEEALTDPSYCEAHPGEKAIHNDRLEFLGDRVVNLCIADVLFGLLPEERVGGLAQKLTTLIRNGYLGKVARRHHFADFMRVGNEAVTTYMLACCFEAVLGAVLRDSKDDYLTAKRVARKLIFDDLPDELLRLRFTPSRRSVPPAYPPPTAPPKPTSTKPGKSPPAELVTSFAWKEVDTTARSKLREIAQRKFGYAPDYKRSTRGGQCIVEVRIRGLFFGKAQGKDLSDAIEKAAAYVLRKTQDLTQHVPEVL